MSVLETFRLDGNLALVTGSSRGLGRAMAIALAEAGADVALVARTKEALQETAALIEHTGRRAAVLPCDVTSPEEIRMVCADAAAALGPVTILVNNAGTSVVKEAQQVSIEEWRKVMAVNVDSYFYFAQALAPGMIEKGRGKIINIGSIEGIITETLNVPYCTSKAAVLHLTKALAAEWARYSICVNAIAPGYFLTDMTRDALEDPEKGPRMAKRIPFRRFGEAHELGPLVVYLASSASDFVTGETVVIDGGQVIK